MFIIHFIAKFFFFFRSFLFNFSFFFSSQTLAKRRANAELYPVVTSLLHILLEWSTRESGKQPIPGRLQNDITGITHDLGMVSEAEFLCRKLREMQKAISSRR